jgi:hypothetical protein
MTKKNQNLKLDQVCINGGTQPRAKIDEQVVAEYADLYRDDVDLPPVAVFFDGVAYWLADGFHRYWARKRIERNDIQAEIHEGTLRDAILYSAGANAAHGLRRTNMDKKRAVLTLLEDDEWSSWSDHEIARRCAVNHTTVMRHRASLVQSTSENPRKPTTQKNSAARKFKTKHGTVATMKTGNINDGRKRSSKTQKPRSPSEFVEARQNGYRGRPTSMVKLQLPNNHVHNCAYDLLQHFTFEYLQKVFHEVVQIHQECVQKEKSE